MPSDLQRHLYWLTALTNAWHRGAAGNATLQEYLKLTDSEYEEWSMFGTLTSSRKLEANRSLASPALLHVSDQEK